MNKIISIMLIFLVSFSVIVQEASAKRFGGGRSFGVQRARSSLFSPRSYQHAQAQPRVKSRPWGGILSGLLIGGLLTSLFMGHGLFSGLFSWIILGMLLLFIFRLFKRPVMAGNNNQFFKQANESPGFNQPFANQDNAFNADYPPGFNEDAFLRDAKRKFLRLQAAFDQKNINDLKEFTTPEVLAEIKLQLQERGDEANHTEVININADLLDISTQADSLMATVRFKGAIQENNEPTTSLDEIWHFRQFKGNAVWLVGGVQQEM